MPRIRPQFVLIVLPLLCVVPARKALGQDISVGSRLRVTWTDSLPKRRTGSLLAVRTERLELASNKNGQPFWVPRQQITQLEMSLSRKRYIIPGVVAGLVAAAAFVAPAALHRNGCQTQKGSCFATGMVAIGLPLGALGGFVGSTMGKDRWKAVDVPAAPPRF